MNLVTVQKNMIQRRILGVLVICVMEIALYTLGGWLILEVFGRPIPRLPLTVLFVALAVPAALIVAEILDGKYDDLLRSTLATRHCDDGFRDKS